MIKKLRLLFFLCALALLGGGWYFFLGSEMNAAEPKHIMQTITENSAVSRTVTWQTEASDLAQTIVYYAERETKQKSIHVEPALLTTGEEEMSIYSVTLENLRPGTVYFYKVGSESNWSEWHSLRTNDVVNPAVKAIVFGDSQCGDYGVWAETARQAWQANGDADFFINMGDLVDIGSHYDQWKCWINGAGRMIQEIPAAPLSGNHENYLPGGTYTPAYLYHELFRLPDNGPAGLKGQAYAFDYGDVHFVALDSQQLELAEFQPDLLRDEVEWLQQDLAKTDRKWKVVLIHRPLFQNKDKGELNELGKVFGQIFDRHCVDIVLSAHIHTYGRSRAMWTKNMATDAAEGTIYISTGRSGDKTWEESKRKSFELAFDRCLDQPNYLVLDAGKEHLKITNFKQDGSIVDIVDLKK